MLSFAAPFALAQLLGVVVSTLTVVWVVKYMGVVWDRTDIRLYNWHAICMVLGMVFFYGNSILVFRLFRNSSKFAVKVVHTIFHSASIIFISLGLAVEFISHYYSGEPDLYSLHSWVGMATIVIFISQFIFGFVCFFFPSISARLKSSYLKIHIFFGVLCFVMAIATSLIGLNQNARFNMIYYELPPEGILINLIGLLMLFYGILVVYLVTKPSFQRKSEVVIE